MTVSRTIFAWTCGDELIASIGERDAFVQPEELALGRARRVGLVLDDDLHVAHALPVALRQVRDRAAHEPREARATEIGHAATVAHGPQRGGAATEEAGGRDEAHAAVPPREPSRLQRRRIFVSARDRTRHTPDSDRPTCRPISFSVSPRPYESARTRRSRTGRRRISLSTVGQRG